MDDDVTLHGPAGWEGSPRRYGPVARVAVLSDIHANVPAFEAVLAEPDVAAADFVVLNGDLTWGPQPQETYELIAALGDRALCVRGNCDRYAAEIGTGVRVADTPRQQWIADRHSPEALGFLTRVPFGVVVEIDGLGPVHFCHGSPRSDHELVTPATPSERFTRLSAAIDARVLVTGHSHLQFDRAVAACAASTREASDSRTTRASRAPRTGRSSAPTSGSGPPVTRSRTPSPARIGRPTRTRSAMPPPC